MKKVDHPTSKRFKEAKGEINPEQFYSVEEAMELAKKTSTTKFDASIEVHINLGIDPKKSDQQVRSSASLPHGSGKTLKVAVCTTNVDEQKAAKSAGADIVGEQDLIEKIKSNKIEFDVLVATPEAMKLLGPVAKILGPRGLMPNPKDGTVTPKVANAVTELKKGKINYKNDDGGNIHVIVGKSSFETSQLKENYETFIDSLNKAKPTGVKGNYIKTATITSAMGPAIKVIV